MSSDQSFTRQPRLKLLIRVSQGSCSQLPLPAHHPAVANFYQYLVGNKTTEDAVAPAGILCDVRDVAQAHVRALLLPEASGKRFGVATREYCRYALGGTTSRKHGSRRAGTFTLQVLLDHIHKAGVPDVFPDAVRGEPGKEVPPQNWFDCSRSLKALELTPTHESRTA